MEAYYKILKAPTTFSFLKIKEIIHYKDVLRALVIKDIKVMYVQTFLGYGWAIINPVLTMLILTIVFGKIGKIETGNIPFVLFALAGIVAWNYISGVINESGRAILSARDLIGKIYFPRIILPLSKALVGLIELVISLACLFVLMLFLGYLPSQNLVFFPIFLLLVIVSGLGIGIWISALSILYRDFYYIIPFILRLGMFITPVAFPFSAIPEKYRMLVYLNPLAAPVEGLRWSILGGEFAGSFFFLSLGCCLILFILSLWYFNRVEHKFADTI
jgi:lipopolysaccharide transport system permease protein